MAILSGPEFTPEVLTELQNLTERAKALHLTSGVLLMGNHTRSPVIAQQQEENNLAVKICITSLLWKPTWNGYGSNPE